MDMNLYQRLALGTERYGRDENERLMNAALGLAGEAGEFCDLLKKVVFHGHPLDFETYHKLRREIGDILWYCALASDALDADLSSVAEDNIEKLRQRYPDGFSTDASVNRREEEMSIGFQDEDCIKTTKELYESKPRRPIVLRDRTTGFEEEE